MIEKIKKILLENPTLSNREIGKIVGLSRSSVQYYLNKLNIHRDRKEQQKLNNTSREKILKISETAEQVIIGSILGDGYISPNRHPIDTSLTLNSELRINHGYKQKEYIEYKKYLLEKEGIKCYLQLIKSSKLKEHYIKGIKIKDKDRYYLKTQRNVSFNFYRNLFYRPDKKLSKYIYKINALGLAIWYMDDGCKNGKGFVLCTDNFTIKEVELLRKVLKHNFNLDTTIQKSNIGNPRIYIRVSCREHFISLISKYICKSMQYKLMF